MGAIRDSANDSFRDHTVQNVPASGEHEPVKPDIRNTFGVVEDTIAAEAAVRDAAIDELDGRIDSVTGEQVPQYASTAAGIAGTVDGEEFIVPGTGDVAYTRYKNVAEVATVLFAVPSNAAIDGAADDLEAATAAVPLNLIPGNPEGVTFAAASEQGDRAPWTADEDGRVVAGDHLQPPTCLAYVKDVAGVDQVFVLDGSGETQITSDAVDASHAHAIRSQGRNAIRFSSERVHGDPYLWACAADGSCMTVAPPDGVGGVVHKVGWTGQSLSGLGVAAEEIIKRRQSWANDSLMFNVGVRTGGGNATTNQAALLSAGSLTALVPLIENTSAQPSATDNGETGARAFVDQLQFLVMQAAGTRHRLLNATYSIGGASYLELRKGGASNAFVNGITGVTKAKTLAEAQPGGKLIQPAVRIVHGETDQAGGTSAATYEGYLNAWQADHDTDIKAVTGQTDEVEMFICQLSSWTENSGPPVGTVPYGQLAASISNANIHLICPKYFLPYADGQHLTAEGYALLGAYFAKAYKKVILDRQTWSPLRPSNVSRSGGVITVTFTGNVGPLVLDRKNVTDPGGGLGTGNDHAGFEFADDSSSTSISSVALHATDSNKVVITLGGTPTGTNKRIRYAYTGVSGALAGPHETGSPKGCLRDSDPTPFVDDGSPLWNWCVHFNEPVT